jgi:hypothetical protein
VVFVVMWARMGSPRTGTCYELGQWLAAVWALCPPLYFFFEWYFWVPPTRFREIPDGEKKAFEEFKYGQDVASKIWIAFAATLGVLFGMK